MATTPLCRLPHGANGRIEESQLWRLWSSYRVPRMREGFLSGSQRDLLDDLSAEATAAGVCPAHVQILRNVIAITIGHGS